MLQKNIIVILAHPINSQNIGSCCRALANCGIKQLRIVGKKQDYDEQKIKLLAIHAFDIWQNATFFDTITHSTLDCTLVAATTCRKGAKRGTLYLPQEFAQFVKKQKAGKVAVVFGNERTGLSDSEVAQCNIAVTIPSDKKFASLNLSHAVQIICYELYKMSLETIKKFSGVTPVSCGELSSSVKEISNNLRQLGFFKKTTSDNVEHFLKSIFARAAVTKGEINYLKKIFSKACNLAIHKAPTN